MTREEIQHENMNQENIPSRLSQIRTISAPKSPFTNLQNSLKKNQISGIKRNAPQERKSNETSSQNHKRKYFGQESEDKLAELFREKILNRRNKNKEFQGEDSEGSELQPMLTSKLHFHFYL